MLDYTQLETLATVLRLGSFEATAHRLNITQSAVSQRIRQLEDRVGAPLVRRGHPCTGTELGNRLARHAEEVALLEQGLSLSSEKATPVLRIAVNADSMATWILPALAQQSGMLFDLVVDDQDHAHEWLKRGEVSAAISSAATPPQGCDSIALGALRYVACASPAFIAKHFPDGVNAGSLATAPMMVFNRKDRLQHSWIQRVFKVIHNGPTHVFPSTHAFVDAAVLGMGWGMNPESLIADHLKNGTLVPIHPDATLETPLYWHFSRALAPVLSGIEPAFVSAARKFLA